MSWQNLTNDQLQALPTKRLLEVFKRQRRITSNTIERCGCCDQISEDLNPDELNEYNSQKEKLQFIKSILDTRSHVKRSVVAKPAKQTQNAWIVRSRQESNKRRDAKEKELDYSEFVGTRIRKKSKKPFKSKNVWNTVTCVTTNPHTNRVAFAFEEDESIVDVRTCCLTETK